MPNETVGVISLPERDVSLPCDAYAKSPCA
jgi:hypothetical protein